MTIAVVCVLLWRCPAEIFLSVVRRVAIPMRDLMLPTRFLAMKRRANEHMDALLSVAAEAYDKSPPHLDGAQNSLLYRTKAAIFAIDETKKALDAPDVAYGVSGIPYRWQPFLVGFLAALVISSGAHATSTANPALPASNQPYQSAPIRNNFQALINDTNALQTCNAGVTAPSAPSSGYCWLDTSGGTSAWNYRVYDGITGQWVSLCVINAVTGAANCNVTAAGGLIVANNVGLAALASTAANTVMRLGVAMAGDAPALNFMPSNSSCSLNLGAGDGGSQVPSADGKCWIANFQPGATDVREWGATPSADIMPFIFKAWQAQTGRCIYIPAGIWLVESSQTFNQNGKQALCIQGDPYTYNGTANGVPTAQTGTWLRWPAAFDTIVSPFQITGSGLQNQTGANVDQIAFEEDQPAPGNGTYTPDTNYTYWFNVFSLYGFRIGHVFFLNDTQCVSLVNGGRMDIDDLRGQPLGTCIFASQLFDIPRWHNIDLWPYWTTNTHVSAYTLTVDPIIDSSGIWADFIFDIGYHSGFKSIQNTDVPLGGNITELYGDAVGAYTFWDTAVGDTWTIGTIQGVSQNNPSIPFLYQAGQNMIEMDGRGSRVHLGHVYVTALGGSLVNDTANGSDGVGNWVDIDSIGFAGAGARWDLASASKYLFQNNSTAGNPSEITVSAIQLSGATSNESGGSYGNGYTNPSTGGVVRANGLLQTWTPALHFGSSGSVTCSSCVGSFIWDTNNVLTYYFSIQLSAISSPTGAMQITGLPEECTNSAVANGGTGAFQTVLGMTGLTTPIWASPASGANVLNIYGPDTGGGAGEFAIGGNILTSSSFMVGSAKCFAQHT